MIEAVDGLNVGKVQPTWIKPHQFSGEGKRLFRGLFDPAASAVVVRVIFEVHVAEVQDCGDGRVDRKPLLASIL